MRNQPKLSSSQKCNTIDIFNPYTFNQMVTLQKQKKFHKREAGGTTNNRQILKELNAHTGKDEIEMCKPTTANVQNITKTLKQRQTDPQLRKFSNVVRQNLNESKIFMKQNNSEIRKKSKLLIDKADNLLKSTNFETNKIKSIKKAPINLDTMTKSLLRDSADKQSSEQKMEYNPNMISNLVQRMMETNPAKIVEKLINTKNIPALSTTHKCKTKTVGVISSAQIDKCEVGGQLTISEKKGPAISNPKITVFSIAPQGRHSSAETHYSGYNKFQTMSTPKHLEDDETLSKFVIDRIAFDANSKSSISGNQINKKRKINKNISKSKPKLKINSKDEIKKLSTSNNLDTPKSKNLQTRPAANKKSNILLAINNESSIPSETDYSKNQIQSIVTSKNIKKEQSEQLKSNEQEVYKTEEVIKSTNEKLSSINKKIDSWIQYQQNKSHSKIENIKDGDKLIDWFNVDEKV